MIFPLHRRVSTCAALLCIVALAAHSVGLAEQTAAGDPAKSLPEKPPGRPAKSAFLGVITSKPPRIMTEQLGLKPDEGLVVIALAPDGPALKAGLAVNDIITAVGDSSIHSSRDLTTAVQARAPGDVARLKLIRKGEAAELDVTLGARPAGAEDAREIDKVLRKLIEERVAAGENPKDLENLARRLELHLTKGGDAMEIPVGASIRIVDAQGCVELRTKGDQKEIVVRDKDDKVTWSGPWNNEADKTAAPPGIARRFSELDIETVFESSRIRLKLPGTRKSVDPEPAKVPAPSADR